MLAKLVLASFCNALMIHTSVASTGEVIILAFNYTFQSFK
jgi:hypothetical protein